MTECLALFNRAREDISPQVIAEALGLNQNTVTRWIEQDRVPSAYRRDLLRVLGENGDKEGSERDKDQFYTKKGTAKHCLAVTRRVMRELKLKATDYHFVEPSAGAGAFYDLLPKDRRTGMDIDPRNKKIEEQDFLTWAPRSNTDYVVVGNPPFGLRGHLALQFINRAAEFADIAAFILPPLFDSDGKGVPAKRVRGYELAHTEELPANSYEYPDGTPVAVETIFQVWTRRNTHLIALPEKPTCDGFVSVYSLSDGGTPSSTRNKKMLHKCDVYLPSTCFSGMKAYPDFEALPHRRGYGVVVHQKKREIQKLLKNEKWASRAFKSTNGALNLRTSIIKEVVIEGGYHD